MTPITLSQRDIFLLRILIALYDDEKADQMSTVFRDNRMAVRKTIISDPNLYGPGDTALNYSDTEGERGPTGEVVNNGLDISDPTLQHLISYLRINFVI